ncbi:MAG: YciI family protein [Actinomycetota bacterium]|nr:YciI family protein [Actinomycetota bacterium]
MRCMVIVKATPQTEEGQMPTEAELAEMGNFNEELSRAGVMVDGEGLHPSSKGVRVNFTGSGPEVIDGPFTEARELIAGYWIWEVKSMDEAVEWARRIPFTPGDGEPSSVEIRQVFAPEDFGEEFTPELQEQEARIRAESARKA